MNESNENDSIFRSNTNIMTSADWKPINDQLHRNREHWSTLLNCQNELQIAKENNEKEISNRAYSGDYYRTTRCSTTNASQAQCDENCLYQPTRSKVMPNETLSNNYPNNYYEPEIEPLELLHCDTNRNVHFIQANNVDNEQPDRMDKLSKLPASLSSHPVTKFTDQLSNRSSIRNVANASKLENFHSISSSLNRSLYERTYGSTDGLRKGEFHINKSTDIELPYSKYLNSSCSTDSMMKKRDRSLSPTNYLKTGNLNKLQYSSLRSDFQLSSNVGTHSNATQPATIVSLKKHGLSLPLKDSLMDKKSSSFDLIRMPQNSGSVNHTIQTNKSNEKSFLEDGIFYQNQPNLATVQTSNNRSLTHRPVQCAKTYKSGDLFSLSNPRMQSSYVKDEMANSSMIRKCSVNKSEQQPTIVESNQLRDQLNEQALEQISKQVSDKLSNEITDQLSAKLSDKLSSELSSQIKDQLRNTHNGLCTDIGKLNTDLLKLNDELNHLNDNLLKNESSKVNENRLKINVCELLNSMDKSADKREPVQRTNQASLIDYNAINLKLNSRLVHLVKHSEVDQKSSSLFLNLVTEDHCGIILCIGQSTVINAQYSIGYYIGAITQNSIAEHLFTIGDLVLEINSRPLQLNSFMNLEKVTNLMNHQFNMKRYLQLRIVPRALLMSQFRKKDDTQFGCNYAIRTVSGILTIFFRNHN